MNQHRELFLAFSRLQQPYRKHLNERLEKINLSSAQWFVLYFISNEGPQTVSAIATHQHIERPTSTKVVQKLVESGYVEVTPGADKRVKHVSLTTEGKNICDDVEAYLSNYQQELAADFTQEEQALVTRFLKTVMNKL
ncbi:MarR family winged helix-turn-helix transcriptional regulator [Brochothrix campestris]|uniref:MarR family transcriptional regulator n=1 Tax=Brochothrix campestris FSL F6-1037 TaxID=1265861 RepID=W7CG55_9LIST|nr:MarR family transcriptional regulator [Brochothrix campestris]EUJ38374.1 MarR family transcriptional regulator [Brochothrix campestris FSL F6-1037]